MTSLMAWVSHDNRRPAAVYLATDSRISWPLGNSGSGSVTYKIWETSQKTFLAHSSPELFGYCGVSLLTTQVISQLVDAINFECISPISGDYQSREKCIVDWLNENSAGYPSQLVDNSQIAHVMRIHDGNPGASEFAAFVLTWTNSGWHLSSRPIPEKSRPFILLGSGQERMKIWYERWSRTDVKGTSRSIFSALCDAITDGGDPRSGGALQAISLRPRGQPLRIGYFHNGRAYFAGAIVTDRGKASPNIDWRNRLFERVDPRNGEVIGQRQPQPKLKDPST